ncbi:hypothetical protein BDN70DRAFT_856879 [Pholiota conissans]|uniref:Mitochondrial DNA polymerase catalytic subunit n=1 Tax=Pholiota conissans TaxID=109636 RepID=A0A9P5Z3H6_9AGAR|nr:hypothetical protein BDN70DRAFT_856879 [Pholiota conissans]
MRTPHSLRPHCSFSLTIQNHLSITKSATPQTHIRSRAYTQSCQTAKESFPAERNELGVQLLSRSLHAQVFKGVSFPSPPASYVQISKEHLQMHGLDPSQGSTLPNTEFQLPVLQGSNIAEHFHRIGAHVSEPWLSLAKTFASASIPPKPDNWIIQSGWTKYYYLPNGSIHSERVDAPVHNGKPEEMLTFDVETMPNYHSYAIMACAASPNAWYAWISPWLLEESLEPGHLIPLGSPSKPKVIIGHNVSYDRIRILEEYNIKGSENRFVDTMSLHVAVNGISSHQRPAWLKYRKSKQKEKEQNDVVDSGQRNEGSHSVQRDELDLLQAQYGEDGNPDISAAEAVSKRWEDITSTNSLAEVAKLHCGIEVSKEARDDFMTMEPKQIREDLTRYLDYCSGDVSVTHQVYTIILPAFLISCPHPVSFAGMLTMGSSFLPVDENWEIFLQRADAVYNAMEEKVQKKLKQLAEDARSLADKGDDAWKSDPWLNQLDWTPKVAGKSRGVFSAEVSSELTSNESAFDPDAQPCWYMQLLVDPFAKQTTERIIPLLLKISYNGIPLHFSVKDSWHYFIDTQMVPLSLRGKGQKTATLFAKYSAKHFSSGLLSSTNNELALDLCHGRKEERERSLVIELANSALKATLSQRETDPWLSQLDWSLIPPGQDPTQKRAKKPKSVKPPPVFWPKWYWDATKPRKDVPPGTLEITIRNRIAPLLLRLSWLGHPLFHSREHGWTYRVPSDCKFKTRWSPLAFYDPADSVLAEAALSGGYNFYKVPHKDGEKANVGNPLGKSFIKSGQDGILKSPGNESQEALNLNAVCSYWISARDRIRSQLVVWQNSQRSLGFPPPSLLGTKYGVILPQMIPMGTVTRRAIEKTWLTASNAKKNRVGSELKAMVRAPDGYAIVGADVDSEELWISSCMGDAQFGLHGASAIGWMTLEGTKAAGTDLHSKTASILGISRDQAKIFNYSRIYGAGMRYAEILLLQSNTSMLPEEAQKLAGNLYASTKGKNTHRSNLFNRKFWFGGTESYLFNKLEEIALSDSPQTPALGCGVTYALSKEYLPEGFGANYMTSRINWVVQSSGVDYLHLLIVSMNHLIMKYRINARFLISVHDELRYLVSEEDKYRAALALQVSNLWTRSLFAYKLGMDDLPQGVAFFSAVDVDKVLRKEVDMPCVTPSQPEPIPPGESLDITKILARTNGGSLLKNGQPMSTEVKDEEFEGSLTGYIEPDCLSHRATNTAFLKAQASSDFGEIRGLAEQAQGKQNESKRTKW